MTRRPTPSTPPDQLQAAGPHAVQVEPHAVRVGDGWAATLVVTGFPATVGPAWLEPVLSGLDVDRARLDVALHIAPLPATVAATRLRRTRARLEATRRLDADKGRLTDPTTAVTAGDADALADKLARGQSRLFRVGIYLTVHAPTRAALTEAVAQLRAVAASAMLDTHPATWRHLQGWTSTLPLGHDGLDQARVIDTDALALAFPLACDGLPAPLPGRAAPPGGVLIGVEPAHGRARRAGGVVWWDRWSQHNHNSLILARSGAGKSYLVKLDILRSLYDGVQVAVIDPEDEYPPLAAAVGGTTIALGTPGVRINPLDLPAGAAASTAAMGTGGEDLLTRRVLFAHTLVAVLLGQPLPPDERAALDTALTAAYAQAGITADPATWTRPAPLLADVETALTRTSDKAGDRAGDQASKSLAARLRPWTRGSFKTLFDGPTTTRPAGRLVVWSVRHLPDELRAAGMLLALDAIWRDVDTSHPPARRARPVRKLVVVDEAWTLLRDGEGAQFLYRLAKAARKRHAGLVVVTQDAEDLLASDLGKAVAANAATQILMRQAPGAFDALTDTFGLTPTEARALTTAPRAHGLLLGGTHRVPFQVVSSPTEHELCRGAGEDDDLHAGRRTLAKPPANSHDNPARNQRRPVGKGR